MKKLTISVFLAILLVIGTSVVAQETQKQQEERAERTSDLYYVTVGLEKIYLDKSGYIVQYRKGNEVKRAYLPLEWFTGTATKGEVYTLPVGQNWPSLTVYYKEGAFSHLKLFIHPLNTHQTWGNVPLTVNLKDRFDPDADDFRLY